MEEKYSEKQIEARNSLPAELKHVFDDFVADYKYAATDRISVNQFLDNFERAE